MWESWWLMIWCLFGRLKFCTIDETCKVWTFTEVRISPSQMSRNISVSSLWEFHHNLNLWKLKKMKGTWKEWLIFQESRVMNYADGFSTSNTLIIHATGDSEFIKKSRSFGFARVGFSPNSDEFRQFISIVMHFSKLDIWLNRITFFKPIQSDISGFCCSDNRIYKLHQFQKGKLYCFERFFSWKNFLKPH